MAKPWAFIPWMPGTNCHLEMAYAFEKAGARAEVIPLKRPVRPKLYEADLIGLAGGFTFGDHFGAGRMAAIELLDRFGYELREAINRRIPMIGICNGFQIMVVLGLLPRLMVGKPTAALDLNLTARFEHWWSRKLVMHEPPGVDCIWTTGLDGAVIQLPVAHGEGRSVLLPEAGQPHVVATYGTAEGTAEYPDSPSGSPIAGYCDDSGLLVGLMPHPERRVDDLRGGTDGLALFVNGVEAVK